VRPTDYIAAQFARSRSRTNAKRGASILLAGACSRDSDAGHLRGAFWSMTHVEPRCRWAADRACALVSAPVARLVPFLSTRLASSERARSQRSPRAVSGEVVSCRLDVSKRTRRPQKPRQFERSERLAAQYLTLFHLGVNVRLAAILTDDGKCCRAQRQAGEVTASCR
jgi:hypothetical protein